MAKPRKTPFVKGTPVAEPKKSLIDELRPADLPDYAMPAWIGFIYWALGEPEVIAQFRKMTGNKWEPGQTPIERMIDDATETPHKFIIEFIKWANENMWGPWEGDE